MVANKIKSTTTPVGFHGHIRHQSLMSRVSGAILSAGLLWSLPHTPQQNRPLHQYFTGRALTGHEVVILPKGKKISSSSNTAGGLFNSAPQSMSSKRVKPVSGLFFFWRMGENCVDFGVSLVSLHHRSEGSSDFYRAYGWHFDFGSALLTLMSAPAIFLAKKKVVTRQGGMCNIYCDSLTVP